MAALPQTGRQPAPPVTDAQHKAAIARAKLKACPADVAVAWSEDYPTPQSSFNSEHVAPTPPPVERRGCLRCFEGPGSMGSKCTGCPTKKQRASEQALALAT